MNGLQRFQKGGNEMMLRKYITTACVAGSMTLTLTGSAMAADVNVSNTGANSSQAVVINDTSDVVTTNTSVVSVTNENSQQATTGDVTADGNTSVGGLVQSGDASNSNSTDTTVAVTNEPVAGLPAGGEGTSSGTVGGTGTNNGGGTPAAQGGNVLGAATVGGVGGAVAMLPVTGPSVPVDVSALRAAWHAQTPAPIATLAKNSQLFTGAMLITATLLSLLGGLGSAWYAKRREERV